MDMRLRWTRPRYRTVQQPAQKGTWAYGRGQAQRIASPTVPTEPQRSGQRRNGNERCPAELGKRPEDTKSGPPRWPAKALVDQKVDAQLHAGLGCERDAV